ncbi:MAG TPA: CPBP family intramembrane glutamic endopeptidase [Methylovirgula sp.]|jgi:membrane protease YdiL (CAAX protease family)|nr:CPBP family intramembrane glutamic endopeptidase [Methylovirgula sp.]
MEAAADASPDTSQGASKGVSQAGRPFGILGLCLSLIGLAVLALIGTLVICGLILAVVATVMGWQHFGEVLRQALNNNASEAFEMRGLLAAVLAFYVAVAGAVLIAAKWRGGAKWRDLVGWLPFRVSDWRTWAIMAGALAYSAAASVVIGHFWHSTAQLTIPSDWLAAAILFVIAAVVAPVTEELLFRGWIYTSLRFAWGFWPALLISSVLFALAHYDQTHIYALAVFPIGMVIGIIRERAGIKASIVFHAINNLAAFCLAAIGNG